MKESFFTGRVGLQSPSAKMRLALIFVLSVITPIILQAQNSTTNGDAIQTQGTSNRIPSDIQGLTPDLLAKLLTKVSEIGADKDFPGFLASVLGLTKPDASWAMRQIVVKETTSDTYHEFAVSRTGDPDMLFISRHGHGMMAA